MRKYSSNQKGEILKDGHTMLVGDIVRELNERVLMEAEKITEGKRKTNIKKYKPSPKPVKMPTVGRG